MNKRYVYPDEFSGILARAILNGKTRISKRAMNLCSLPSEDYYTDILLLLKGDRIYFKLDRAWHNAYWLVYRSEKLRRAVTGKIREDGTFIGFNVDDADFNFRPQTQKAPLEKGHIFRNRPSVEKFFGGPVRNWGYDL